MTGISGRTRTQRTEQEYRQVDLDSSSSLKVYADSPVKYFKQFVMGEKEVDDENKSTIVGSLVHVLLLEGQEEFDRKFHLSALESKPTAMMLDFVLALYKHTEANLTEDGEVTVSFDTLVDLAYPDSGFKISKEAVLKKFIGSNAEAYYSELREVKKRGLIVVTEEDIRNAERVVDELKYNEYTGPIVNRETDEDYIVLNELQVEGFEIDDLPLKGMLDKTIIDKVHQTVQITDLKICWSVGNFYNEYYLHRKTYIQAYLYYKAIEYILPELVENPEQYVILPPQFLVADSIGYYQPIIYKLSLRDIEDAYNGFYERGWYYPGVKEVIENLKWSKENNLWRISREAYINNGILPLRKIA